MARQFLTSIDLNQNELLNARVQNLGTAPANPVPGQLYYDSDDDMMYFWNGTSWRSMDGSSAGIQESIFGANTILKADVDDTPVALTVGEDTLVGRISGGTITALSVSEVKALLAISDAEVRDLVGAMVDGNTETGITVTYESSDGTFDFVISPLNDLPAPDGDLSMATFKITDLATPTSSTDAATKGYVDSVVNGLSWKDAVRVATTTAGTLASDFEAGDTVDGVTLVAGDRILVKNQADAAENGIYVVQASGAPQRAADAASGLNVTGLAVFVDEGTSNADTAWVQTTNDAEVGTDDLVFAQFGAGATYTAGSGLTLTGNEFSVNVDDSTIEISSGNLRVKDGGITDDKLASEFTKVYSEVVGDGSSTSFEIEHNMDTSDVVVFVYSTSSGAKVDTDVSIDDANTVTVAMSTAPASGAYRVVVVG